MLSFLLSLLVVTSASPQAVTLTVTTSAAEKGDLCVAVFANQEDYLAKRSIAEIVKPLAPGQTRIDVEVPASGNYVFAAFQDLNGNRKLDTNMLGVPTEPYGFTETPLSKWREPAFGEIATTVPAGETTSARIQLKRWKEY